MASNADLDARYTQLLQNDPEIQRLSAQMKAASGRGVTDGRALQGSGQKQAIWNLIIRRAQQLGVPTDDWAIDWSGSGVGVDHQNFIERHPTIAALLIGGSFLGGAALLGGGAAATGGGSAAAYSAPAPVVGGSAGTAGAPAYGGAVAGGGGAGAGAGAGGVGSSIVSTNPFKWTDAIFAGIDTGLNYLERRAQNKETQKRVDAAIQEQRRATAEAQARLDRQDRLSGELYGQNRTDYQNTAGIPFQTLGSLLGMNIPTVRPVTFQNQMPTDPTQIPSGSGPMTPGPFAPGSRTGAPGSGLGAPGTTAPPTRSLQDFANGGGMVHMQAPNGATKWVPAHEAGHYESRGARRL